MWPFRKEPKQLGPQRVYFQWMQCCGYGGMFCGATVTIDRTGDWQEDYQLAAAQVHARSQVCTADPGDVDALFVVPQELSHLTDAQVTRLYLDKGPAGAMPGDPWLKPFKINTDSY